EVTGVDFAGRAVRAARRKARQAGVDVELRVGDVMKASTLAGRYDLVLDLGCFHSLPQEGRQSYIRNVEELLAPEGTYLLYVFLKTAGNEFGPGVTDAELAALPFRLTARRDADERGRRPSAWLTFGRK
ncbi:MAG: class I SAM-dependent methyltransferase, partial [Chloroflexi bacterium]|nr:class I SAM-dependent methyltransferase [Chloroflexota bacterium]